MTDMLGWTTSSYFETKEGGETLSLKEKEKKSFEDTKRNLTSLSKASFNYRLHTDGENRLPTPSAVCQAAVRATKTKADSGSAPSHSLRGNCFNYRFFQLLPPSLSAPMLNNFLLRN